MENNLSRIQNLERPLQDLLSKVSPDKADGFIARLSQFLEEHDDVESRIEKLTADSARRQFFKAIYDRDYHLVKLLLTGSRRKYVHSNLICPEDRWTALHACLYKYNQYQPEETLRIVKLLLEHSSDVNQPCPEGAVAINVLDKKPLPNGQQNGPDNPNREKKTVSFQNKMVLDVAIDFLQAYKWAGCRPSVLANWKPLIELLDEASINQKTQQLKDYNSKFTVTPPKTMMVDIGYQKKFKNLLDKQIGIDCEIIVNNNNCSNLEEKTYGVHRAILMASSPVFQAMFKADMLERKNSEVKIDDIPSLAVKLMLCYIYGGKLPNNEMNQLNIGLAVLCLSDKYAMNDLKHHCEYHLHKIINIENALQILIASHMYNAQRLRNVSLNYVCEHFNVLSQSPKFKNFADKNPKLLQEILTIVTKEIQSRPHKKFRFVTNFNNYKLQHNNIKNSNNNNNNNNGNDNNSFYNNNNNNSNYHRSYSNSIPLSIRNHHNYNTIDDNESKNDNDDDDDDVHISTLHNNNNNNNTSNNNNNNINNNIITSLSDTNSTTNNSNNNYNNNNNNITSIHNITSSLNNNNNNNINNNK